MIVLQTFHYQGSKRALAPPRRGQHPIIISVAHRPVNARMMKEAERCFGVRRHVAAFLDATCRVGPKRGNVRALQSRIPNSAWATVSFPVFILGWTIGAIGV